MKSSLKSAKPKAANSPNAARPEAAALQQMPGHLIRRAHQISTSIFAEECGHADLTSVQFAALFALRGAGNLDATRLAELIAFDRSTIGDVVQRLESKGWIAREGANADKRIKTIRLTAAGATLLAAIEPDVARVQERLFEPLSHLRREKY